MLVKFGVCIYILDITSTDLYYLSYYEGDHSLSGLMSFCQPVRNFSQPQTWPHKPLFLVFINERILPPVFFRKGVVG